MTQAHNPEQLGGKKQHLPLQLLIELLTESIDTIPVQVLVQGVCRFVCR